MTTLTYFGGPILNIITVHTDIDALVTSDVNIGCSQEMAVGVKIHTWLTNPSGQNITDVDTYFSDKGFNKI